MDAWAEVSAKYDRAQKHINDLEACLDAFRKSNPYTIGEKRDAQAGKMTYYLASVRDIPPDIPLILGDALQNLRSTLDHLVWKIVERAGGTPGTHTGFPIFDDAKGYDALAPGKVEGAGQYAIEAINRLNPYKAGNHYLWMLHRLNNIDKHRLLLTVCHAKFGHSMTPSEQEEFLRKRGEAGGRTGTRYEVSYTQSPPAALHAGDELRTVPLSEADQNVGIVIDIAINEHDVAKGEPLTLLLGFLRMEVSLVINDLERFV